VARAENSSAVLLRRAALVEWAGLGWCRRTSAHRIPMLCCALSRVGRGRG
jgi:hypothetical protein